MVTCQLRMMGLANIINTTVLGALFERVISIRTRDNQGAEATSPPWVGQWGPSNEDRSEFECKFDHHPG